MWDDVYIVYEPANVRSGWFQGSAGITLESWWDRDLTSEILGNGGDPGGGGVIPIEILGAPFVNDPDIIFPLDGSPGTPLPLLHLPPGFVATAGIWVEVTASLFLDDDLIFTPIAVRALGPPDQMLKNEIRRIR